MIKVTLSNNTNRVTVLVPETDTIKDTLQNNNIIIGAGTLSLDGMPLGAGDINKTFAQMNITDSCFLVSIVKSDNAK